MEKSVETKERNKIWTRGWRVRNKAKHNAYQRAYRLAHIEQYKKYHKKYYLNHQENKSFYPNWTPAQKYDYSEKKKQVRHDCLYAYSNGAMNCQCCGIKDELFLTLDHVQNDGYKEKKIGSKRRLGGTSLYHYLNVRGFPNKEKYQVLCWNCNCGKNMNDGVCPHEMEVFYE